MKSKSITRSLEKSTTSGSDLKSLPRGDKMEINQSSEIKAYLYKGFDEEIPEGSTRSLMMTVAAGEGTDGDGNEYHMTTTLGGRPILTSKKTGRRFMLPWETIVAIAVQAGINVTTAKGKASAKKS